MGNILRVRRGFRGMLSGAAAAVLEAASPAPCPACLAAPPDRAAPDGLCAACRAGLERVLPPFCPGCGGTNGGVLDLCPECLRLPPRPWSRAAACFPMRGTARLLVHRLKYMGHAYLARPMAAIAAGHCVGAGIEGVAAVAPVPLHWTRRLVRGYNQSELVAGELARHLGVPLLHPLRRSRRTPPQSTRPDAESRRRNMAGAFAARPVRIPRNGAILLLDDVMTTGATLASAAQALREAGAADVCVLALARR